MSDGSARSSQVIGASVVLIAFVGLVIYGWGWGGYSGTLPYAVGLLCTALAVIWALYERT